MKSRTLLAVVVGGALLAAAAIGAWTSSSQGATPGDDALTAARFELTIEGASIGAFWTSQGSRRVSTQRMWST